MRIFTKTLRPYRSFPVNIPPPPVNVPWYINWKLFPVNVPWYINLKIVFIFFTNAVI